MQLLKKLNWSIFIKGILIFGILVLLLFVATYTHTIITLTTEDASYPYNW